MKHNFKTGDYVYRPSHLDWGKCLVKFVGTIIIRLETSEGEYKDVFSREVKLIPAELYESELYKALHE